MIVSRPFIVNWSFSEIGKPCNGPITFPLFARKSSVSFARANARSTNISVRQSVCSSCQSVTWLWRGVARTSWCATIALFKKAVVTSIDDHSEVLNLRSITSTSIVSVISNSRAVSNPHFNGTSKTLSCSSGGSWISQSAGILSCCFFLRSADLDFQSGNDSDMRDIVEGCKSRIWYRSRLWHNVKSAER